MTRVIQRTFQLFLIFDCEAKNHMKFISEEDFKIQRSHCKEKKTLRV
jgi:hypothetical protein